MPGPLPWLTAFAHHRGLRYEPEADERWLRAWEPYATVKVPHRYEHAIHATGGIGSLSIARAVLELPGGRPDAPLIPLEVGTWLAIVQDERITHRAAATSDFASPFSEPLELVTLPRHPTGDSAFDHVFATFAASADDLVGGVTPSLRKLLLTWRVPVHAELRPGGFVLAPVSVGADDRGLAWLLEAIQVFGNKATKRRS